MRSPWGAYNHGAGARIWFVMRQNGSEYHYSKARQLVRYASYEAATKVAARLNAEENDR